MTARRGSLQTSSTCSKPMSYSMTQVLKSHHEVGLPSYPSQLRRVRKGICDKEGSGMVGKTPWAGKYWHHPTHATFTAFGNAYVHNSIVKIFGRTFTKFLQESRNYLGKIIARFVTRMFNNPARSLQESCKILTKFFHELFKNLAKFLKILGKCCKNYPTSYEIIQDTCQVLPRSRQDFARIMQHSCKNYPRILQDSCKIHARFVG